MKRYSLWVKCLVFFLAVVTLLGVAVSGLGILAAESMSMYSRDDYRAWLYDRYHNMAENLADQVMREYAGQHSRSPQWVLERTGYAYAIQNVKGWYELADEDWYYTILDPSGKEVASTEKELEEPLVFMFGEMSSAYPVIVTRPVTMPETDETEMIADQTDVPMETTPTTEVPEPSMAAQEVSTEPSIEPQAAPTESIAVVPYNADEYYDVLYNPYTDEEVWVQYDLLEHYQINIGVRGDHVHSYISNGISQTMMKQLFAMRYALIIAVAVCLLLFVVAFIFLLSITGKDPKNGEANPRALNKLPLDLYLAAAVFITIFGCIGAFELLQMLFDNDGYNVLMIILLCGCGIGVATTDVGFFCAVAAQFKVSGGFWWRHSVCGRVLKYVWKLLCIGFGYIRKPFAAIGRLLRDTCGMLPVIWEWIAIGGFLGLVLVIFCSACASHWYTVSPMVLWCLVFAALVTYCGYCYGVIQKGIRRMKEGDLNEKIDTQWLFGSFEKIAKDLNALADVVIIAAEKQLKAERMKTELITNVSHDIKTPLTSVINYVDLLQQPHTEEEGQQYLEVLSRQSCTLKKLVEDLMDMSKASSGNMAVNITSVDAVETVNQALGEFADKLENANLTPVFRSPDSQLHMLADGRLTWRVLSNLLSNVVKYALPGTRVYVDLKQEQRWVVLSMKNISREELNISAEELTERFVRGDASRNTEGSGLGLNIAQSLMRLQHGNMEVTVDGDLFKVTLAFPTE